MITVYDPTKPARSALSAILEYIKGLPWAADYDIRPEAIPIDAQHPLAKSIITIEDLAASTKAIGFNDYLGTVNAPDGSLIEVFGKWQEIEYQVDIWTCRETGGSDERAIIQGNLLQLNQLPQIEALFDVTSIWLVEYKTGQHSYDDTTRLYRGQGTLEVKALFTNDVTYAALKEVFLTVEEGDSGASSIDITD